MDCLDPNAPESRDIRHQRTEDFDLFNWAWLTTLQRQLELTHPSTSASQLQRGSASVMDIETLEYLGDELVHLCDTVERYGFVDFQMGIAEEEIIDRK
jgi:hypothetical protein